MSVSDRIILDEIERVVAGGDQPSWANIRGRLADVDTLETIRGLQAWRLRKAHAQGRAAGNLRDAFMRAVDQTIIDVLAIIRDVEEQAALAARDRGAAPVDLPPSPYQAIELGNKPAFWQPVVALAALTETGPSLGEARAALPEAAPLELLRSLQLWRVQRACAKAKAGTDLTNALDGAVARATADIEALIVEAETIVAEHLYVATRKGPGISELVSDHFISDEVDFGAPLEDESASAVMSLGDAMADPDEALLADSTLTDLDLSTLDELDENDLDSLDHDAVDKLVSAQLGLDGAEAPAAAAGDIERVIESIGRFEAAIQAQDAPIDDLGDRIDAIDAIEALDIDPIDAISAIGDDDEMNANFIGAAESEVFSDDPESDAAPAEVAAPVNPVQTLANSMFELLGSLIESRTIEPPPPSSWMTSRDPPTTTKHDAALAASLKLAEERLDQTRRVLRNLLTDMLYDPTLTPGIRGRLMSFDASIDPETTSRGRQTTNAGRLNG